MPQKTQKFSSNKINSDVNLIEKSVTSLSDLNSLENSSTHTNYHPRTVTFKPLS